MAALVAIVFDHHHRISSALRAIDVQPPVIPFHFDHPEPFAFLQITTLDGIAIGVREYTRWKIARFGAGLFSEFHCDGPMLFAINFHEMLHLLLPYLEGEAEFSILVYPSTRQFVVHWSTDNAEDQASVYMRPLALLPGYELPLDVFALGGDEDDNICIQLDAKMFERYLRICRQLLVQNPDLDNDDSVNDLRFVIRPAAAKVELQTFGFRQILSRASGHYLVGLDEDEDEDEDEEEEEEEEIHMVFFHRFDCFEGPVRFADSVRLYLNQALEFNYNIGRISLYFV